MVTPTDLITRKQTAKLFGVSPTYIPTLTLKKLCPEPFMSGPRTVVYLRQQVETAAAAYHATKNQSQQNQGE